MTKILHKRGSGEPAAESLDVGEIALDTSSGTAYTKLSDGTVVDIGGSGGDSAGAGMVIQPDEPADPVTGLQWLDSTTGRVWLWDDDKWLEFPAACSDGGGSGGGGGSVYQATAATDLKQGDPVQIRDDSSVEVCSGAPQALDVPSDLGISQISGGAAQWTRNVYMDKHDMWLLVYEDVSTGARKVIGQLYRILEDGSIKLGNTVQISGEDEEPYELLYDSVKDVATVWIHYAVSQHGAARCIKVDSEGELSSTLTVSNRMSYSISGHVNGNIASCVDPVNNAYYVCWRSSSSFRMRQGYYQESDNTIRWGNTKTIASQDQRSPRMVYDPKSGYVVILNYNNAESKQLMVYLIETTGQDSNTVHGPTQATGYYFLQNGCDINPDTGEIVAIGRMRDGVSPDDSIAAIAIKIDGTNVTAGQPVLLGDHQPSYPLDVAYSTETGFYYCLYYENVFVSYGIEDEDEDSPALMDLKDPVLMEILERANVPHHYIHRVELNGLNITPSSGRMNVLNGAISSGSMRARLQDNPPQMIACWNGSKAQIKRASLADGAVVSDTLFIGMAASDCSVGSKADVLLVGNVADQPNADLLPGHQYFVQPDGTLSEDSSSDQPFAGTALEQHKIIVKG